MHTGRGNGSRWTTPHRRGGYQSPEEFFFAELFERETLRQGWGVPGLDVTRHRDSFIVEYVFACWKYWRVDGPLEVACRRTGESPMSRLAPHFRRASGRFTILERMNRMNRNDVVFVPRTMREGHHDRGFTVVTIAGDYRFEREREHEHSWLKDFGHQRPVKWARSYEYSDCTLPASHFQVYRAAICEVAPSHEVYSHFNAFVERVYLQDIRSSHRN